MPSAIKYIPPTDIARAGFNSEVEQERRQRRDRYEQALAYYLGDQPAQIDYDPKEDDPDDNTMINLVQMTADRTCSFLFPSVPEFETDPEAVEDTDEEKWIKGFFEYNGGLQALIKLALRGFLSGHSFARVKPAPQAIRGQKGIYPSFTVLEPTTITVYWKADDVADVLWYEMRYLVGDRVYIQDFVKSRNGKEWAILTYRSVQSNDNLNGFPGMATAHGSANVVTLDMLNFEAQSVFEVAEPPAIHTSPIPPIIEFPHLPHPNDYYGLGEFTQQQLQDTINRIVSIRNRIARETSDPVDVATGTDVDDVENSDGLITLANPAAKITRLEMKGDLAGITGVLDKLIETYLAIARVVLLKGEAKDLQRVTNASVRTLFLDALSKNSILQSAYGSGLTKVAKLVLQMGFEAGQLAANPAEIELHIKFPTPLPVDDTEIANQNAIMVNMGARSKRTAATKMGDDWKFESAAMEAEAALENKRALEQGQVAAQNAAAMADALPAPTTAPGASAPAKPKPKAPVKPTK